MLNIGTSLDFPPLLKANALDGTSKVYQGAN